MHGMYGDEAIKNLAIELPNTDAFRQLPLIDQQDAALMAVCKEAPIRICEEELISGSATLGVAFRYPGAWHCLPALLDGKALAYGANHLTIGFDKVLRIGMDGIENEVQSRMQDAALTERQQRYLKSLQNAIDGMRVWHKRYLDATQDIKPHIHALLARVPFQPARTFHEAVQCVWFVFAYTRLLGAWPGIGRLDSLLGPYLQKDLKEGRITLPEAREILASFFIKGCEWIEKDTPAGTGDAQHYQNLVLAGRDAAGKETCNEVTYLILDIVEETGISDFPITMRIHQKTPEKLLRKIAKVMRHGGGVIAIYNEELIFESLRSLGYPKEEIPLFANDGCWEVQIPGCTDFIYHPMDALQLLNRVIGADGDGEIPAFRSAEDIYQTYLKELEKEIEQYWQADVATPFLRPDGTWGINGDVPFCPHIDLFEDDCIQKARGYYDLGTRYTVRSPHLGGAPDVGNSLYAMEKAVFEDQLLSFPELIGCIRNNWEGNEVLRLMIKNRYTYYGNDFDESDRWHARLLNDFADLVRACDERHHAPVRYIPGISTFGRQIDWLPKRMATAFGARKGDILSGNDSPTPGTDAQGATAIIRSHCKADLKKQTCGCALDIKIFPDSLKGENGITALKALMRGFLAEGGYFMQLDTVDTQTLLDARAHPEQDKTLSVRVSGWNARFVTLCHEWQDMIIQRTAQNV